MESKWNAGRDCEDDEKQVVGRDFEDDEKQAAGRDCEDDEKQAVKLTMVDKYVITQKQRILKLLKHKN